MNPFLPLVWTLLGTTVWITAIATILMLLPRISQRIADLCARAPMLDFLVALLTWVPWVAGGVFAGWRGVAGSILGELAGTYLWIMLHELLNPRAARGPRIITVLNRTVGLWRNHTALFFTLIALPGFWLVRLHEILIYPSLVILLNFPRYRHGDWVNVSRQKFEGLIGHDLFWCLYCDWMTGVYCLGAEMLRNVESFWCPIRFYENKKCENCKVDFPDIANGWVPADGSMKDVAQVVEKMYGSGERTWFNHPARLTVRGEEIDLKR